MGCSLHVHYLYHYLGSISADDKVVILFEFFSQKTDFVNQFVFCIFRYENTPIQIYRKSRLQKLKISGKKKNLIFFIFLLQT